MAGKLSSSMEDYIKAIHLLEDKRGYVRVKDIAEKLHITMPSVSSALNTLKKRGLVTHKRYDAVNLTEEGRKLARGILKRHDVLLTFFSRILGLDHEIAEKDACAMEHAISPETMESLMNYVNGLTAE